MPDHSSKKVRKKKTFTLRKLKNWLLGIVGLTVILLAISFTLIRVAIKSIPDYSLAIQQAVSEQMGITLKVGVMDAEIYWLVPRLNLIDVDVSDKTGKKHLFYLDEISLSLDWASTIQKMQPIVGEITLVGLNVQLGINKNSQLLLEDYIVDENIDKTLNVSSNRSLKAEVEVNDAVKHNFNNLNFKIIKSQVRLYDYRHIKHSKTLTNFKLHLINSGDSHVFEIEADLPLKFGRHVHFVVDVEGDLFDYKNLDGELYLALDDIVASSWLDDYWDEIKLSANANLSGEVWLEWSKREITDVNSRINISDLAVHYLDEDINTWNIDQLDAVTHWSKENDGWKLDIRELFVNRDDIDWPEPAAATLRMLDSKQEARLRADFFRIDGFVYLAGMIDSVTDFDVTWLSLINKYKPSGELRNIDIKLPVNAVQNIKINTEFSQLGFSLPDTEPVEIKNLRGAVSYLDNKTWLALDSKNTEIKFKDMFRNSINLSDLKGTLELSHQSGLWELSTHSLIVNTPHLNAQARVNFNMPDEGRPFLDLTANFKNGDARFVNLYLPAGVMGKNTVAWLDRALIDGEITQGGYQFYGYLHDAPFRNGEGVSLADFDVSGVQLDYLEKWPVITDMSANLRFLNDTMLINSKKARLFDSDIKETIVYIDNFVSPTLDVKGNVEVELQDLKRFTKESPLAKKVTSYISNLRFDGRGSLDLELFLPLYGDYRTEVGGELLIKNGGLKFENENYKLNKINGSIRFTGDEFEASGLTAELAGNKPGRLLNIDIATKRNQKNRSYHIDVNGEVLASSLLAPIPEYQAYLNGSANWDVDIDIDIDNKRLKGETVVNAQVVSDLQGVTSSLPGPLSKSSKDQSPIKIDINMRPNAYINYELFMQNGDQLKLKQLKHKLLILADTQSVKGNIDVNILDDVDIPTNIDLEYLDLNSFLKLDEKEAAQQESSQLASAKSISPRDFPSLDFHAKKILWKKSVYNDGELMMQKNKLGTVIKSFKFSGLDHVITGKGSWFEGKDDKNITKLDMNIEINDLGKMFKDLNISDSVIAANGNIALDWQWRDTPYNFAWEKLQGNGSLRLRDGTLKDIDAGAGRLLGLFNFKTLLSLDFGTQMKEGFNFDKVNGTFTFANENIYSKDFEIESKAATIYMKGKLSVVNNTIDQIVTVRPHVGGTVTLGAAVVAGPAAGGLVYLFQKIFNTDRLSEYQYYMKGSIDAPEVELKSVPVEEQEEESDF